MCLSTVVVNGCASAPNPYERLRFEDLAGWQYVDGLQGMPERVRALSGRRVSMVGPMLPIDLGFPARVTEALLVRSLLSFEEGENELNHIVRVVKAEGFSGDLVLEKSVEVTGRFEVSATLIDGVCVDIYQIHADRIEPR